MSSQNRIPAGVPSGGQFAAVPRTEVDVRLESSGWSGDRPRIGVDAALDAFPSVVADRVADETAQRDGWDDPTAWDLHIQGIRDATCHPTGREAVSIHVPGPSGHAVAEGLAHDLAARLRGNGHVRVSALGGSAHLAWSTPVTDHDRDIAGAIYGRIGPIVAGNMDAKARNLVVVPGGVRLTECRMGRRHVDVTVTRVGPDTYDVEVSTAERFGVNPERIGRAGSVPAHQLQGHLLAIGDGKRNEVRSWR